MTEYVITPPLTPSVAVTGSTQRYPVRRIFCVGRNYAAHAREMGKDLDREPPFFFTKPADAVVDDNANIPYPPETGNFHYEAELVVAIGKGGVNIDESVALDHVWGYAIGNDLTRRDLQATAKQMGVRGTGVKLLTILRYADRCIRSVRSVICSRAEYDSVSIMKSDRMPISTK